MTRKLIFMFVILGLVGVGIAANKFFSQRSPKQGILKVNSNPSVTIFLDNRHIGRSPYEDKVDEGEYTIKLTPESSVQPISSWQGKVKLFRNLLTYVNADLGDSEFNSAVDVLWLEKITSSGSEISVVTNPDGATLTLDGVIKGISPVSVADVNAGDHTLLVTSPGFAQRSVKVKTTAGYKLLVFIKLALTGTDLGSQQIESTGSAISTPSATPRTTIKVSGSPTPTLKLSLSPTKKVTPSPTSKISVTPNPSGTDPQKPYILIKDTPTGYLNVRSETNTQGPAPIGKVLPGEKYSILDTGTDSQNRTWYKIAYDGTNEGWVIAQYTEKVE